jgi:hypothetical protein
MGLFPECPHCHCEAEYVGPGRWACPRCGWVTECSIACPVCNTETEFSDETHLYTCPACGWTAKAFDTAVCEPDVVEERRGDDPQDASVAAFCGRIVAAVGIVFLAAYIVFFLCEVRPTLLSVTLFVVGLLVYALLGYRVVMSPGFDARTAEDHDWASASMDLTIVRFVLIYGVLYAGAILGWCLVGAYRFAVQYFTGATPPVTGGRPS